MTVNFTANATDADGDPLTYSWDLNGGGVDDNTAAVNSCAFEYTVSGQFEARVFVYDGTDFGIASLTVTMATPGGNVAPVVTLEATNSSGFSPLNVSFTATVVDPDAGQTHTFEWDFDGDGNPDFNSGTTNTAGSVYSYDDFTFGQFYPRVIVSDGFDSAEDSTEVMVSPPDNPPVFDLFMADVESGPAPLTVTFTAAATDIDGDSISFQIDFGEGAGLQSASEETVHTFNTPGTYNVYMRAEDGIEGTNSSVIVINVTAP
jgi:PKD repeat protein